MPNQNATPIAAQKDNLFGVCHALGNDFGFNPIYLRVALAVLLLFNPEAMLISYAAAGVVVLASRLLVRSPKRDVAAAEQPRLHEVPMPAPAVASLGALERMAA